MERLDGICRSVASAGAGLGFTVIREPMVTVGATFCKPDLVLVSGDNTSAIVADVAVASDGTLSRSLEGKRYHYARGDGATAIRRHVTSLYPTIRDIRFVPLIFS